MNSFLEVYAEELFKAVKDHPNEYVWNVDKTSDEAIRKAVNIVVEKMKLAIASGTFNKDGRAFRETCKVLEIKHTYKAIAHYIANHE